MISGAQGGKALAHDTPIPTPDGFVLMRDIRVGDKVYDENGEVCVVTFATDLMHGHECYRVVFDDGSELVADTDHLWTVQDEKLRKNNSRNGRFDTKTLRTAEMIDSLSGRNGRANYSIALTDPLEFDEKKFLIPPYTLGVWLGDGSSRGSKIYSADPEVIEGIRNDGYEVLEGVHVENQGKALTYRIGVPTSLEDRRSSSNGRFMSNGSFVSTLKSLDLVLNKHIPDEYFQGSVDQRLALVQGLFDTDGYCKPNGRAEFTTINKRLAVDVLRLLRSLGMKPRMNVGRATLNGVDHGEKYRVFVTTSMPIFRIPRKLERQVGGYRPDLRNRYVVSIEPVQSVPVRCIQVDSPNNLYLAGRDYVVTHNTILGPIWLYNEIRRSGSGDYLAVTSNYGLFKLKMLPAMLELFVNILHVGKYWPGLGVLEIAHPQKGFLAKSQHDNMYARILLRTSSAKAGLESATAKAAWLDECVAPETLIDTEIGKISIKEIVEKKLPVRVWSYDVANSKWELKPIVRWISNEQSRPLVKLGSLFATGNHKVYTDKGYVAIDLLPATSYNNEKVTGDNRENMQAVSEAVDWSTEAVLQYKVFSRVESVAAELCQTSIEANEKVLLQTREQGGDFRSPEREVRGCCKSSVVPEGRGVIQPPEGIQQDSVSDCQACPAVESWREWSSSLVATREACRGAGLAQRVCCGNWQRDGSPCLQDRRCRAELEDSDRGRECRESSKDTVVSGQWMDLPPLLKQDGGGLDGWRSSDGKVYNLTIAGNHNYVANGILVSNCGQDEFKYEAWEAVQRRLSIHQGRVLGTTTPYNLGWLKIFVYDPWKNGDKDYDVIQFASTLNPDFPQEEFDRAKRTLPTWRFEMFYEGKFGQPYGLIYSEYKEPDMLSDLDLENLPDNWDAWERIIGVDFGGANNATLYLAKDPETKIWHVYKEELEGGISSKEHVSNAKKRLGGAKTCRAVGGAPSETQPRKDWTTAGLRVDAPPFGDIEVGISTVIECFKSGILKVHPSLGGLRDELAKYQRIVSNEGVVKNDIKDKHTFHRSDALRYACSIIGKSTRFVATASAGNYINAPAKKS